VNSLHCVVYVAWRRRVRNSNRRAVDRKLDATKPDSGAMENTTGNTTAVEMVAPPEWFLRLKLISNIVIPTVYGVVFVAGLIGNATLIYTILANKWMRTKSNVLIVSLAVGDFLLILVSVPFATLLYTTDGWIFGHVICKVTDYFATSFTSPSQLVYYDCETKRRVTPNRRSLKADADVRPMCLRVRGHIITSALKQ